MKIKKILENSLWLTLTALLFSCNLLLPDGGGDGSSNTQIRITPKSADISVGNTAQLVVEFDFTFDDAIDRSITWTSSATNIASLSHKTGLTNTVTGIFPGTATITATTADNASATATITVK